jgi:hypothetical protein
MRNNYKSRIEKGIINPECTKDPVGKFFIRAIVDKKNWGQLITENGWDELFPSKPIKSKKVWNIY